MLFHKMLVTMTALATLTGASALRAADTPAPAAAPAATAPATAPAAPVGKNTDGAAGMGAMHGHGAMPMADMMGGGTPQETAPQQTDGPTGMPGMGMPGMGMGQGMGHGMGHGMGMGMGGLAAHIEGKIAFLRAEIGITDLQAPLWGPVADALRGAAKAEVDRRAAMVSAPPPMTVQDHLTRHTAMLEMRYQTVRTMRDAYAKLFDKLSPDQRVKADVLLTPFVHRM
ncbi:MAG: Spy/CpxP family protein refolding chaperone [Alphaproteobacteria bacterium]